MFQRINRRNEPEAHLPVEDVDSVHGGGAGNEAALENNLITNESNEANNSLIENIIANDGNNMIDDPDSEMKLAHYIENDIKRDDIKRPKKKAKGARDKKPILFNEAKNAGMGGINDLIFNGPPDFEAGKNRILNDTGKNRISEGSGSSKEKEAVPKEIADEGLDNYYLGDLNRFKPKPHRKRKGGNELPLIKEKDDDLPLISEKDGKRLNLSELIQEDPKEIGTGPAENDNLIGDAQPDNGDDDPLRLKEPIIKEDPDALITNIVKIAK